MSDYWMDFGTTYPKGCLSWSDIFKLGSSVDPAWIRVIYKPDSRIGGYLTLRFCFLLSRLGGETALPSVDSLHRRNENHRVDRWYRIREEHCLQSLQNEWHSSCRCRRCCPCKFMLFLSIYLFIYFKLL